MRLGCWQAGSTAIPSGTKTMRTMKTTGEVQNGVRNPLHRSAEGEHLHLPAVRCLREVGECLPCMLFLQSIFFHHLSRLGSSLLSPMLSSSASCSCTYFLGPFLC